MPPSLIPPYMKLSKVAPRSSSCQRKPKPSGHGSHGRISVAIRRKDDGESTTSKPGNDEAHKTAQEEPPR